MRARERGKLIHYYFDTGGKPRREIPPGSDYVVAVRVMARGGEPLRLAHLTGQRPADVLGMSETHISGGVLHVRQGKTKAKLRMVIEGELEVLPTEIRAFKVGLNSTSPALLMNETGKKPTTAMLRKRFDAARALAGITSGDSSSGTFGPKPPPKRTKMAVRARPRDCSATPPRR